jgi:hypothetical protein
MKTTGLIRKSFSVLVLLSASHLLAQELPTPPSDSRDGPTEDMMAPVKALVRYMAHVDGAVLPTVFADDGLVIVENFPPYIFNGKDAAAHWDAGYRKHVGRLKDLKCDFGTATISTARVIGSISCSPPLGAARNRKGSLRSTAGGRSC